MQTDVHADVLLSRQGVVGQITLNRPKALNALSLSMIRVLTRALTQWAHDPEIQVLALRGQGRAGPFGAFCAGGDIRFFHEAALSGDPRLEDFFTEEYALNHLIHHYPKPLVVLMDGIIMGGGMGLAQGARWRLSTERTQMAMPETQIGLFPDVGGGYFLARCPGHLGEFLGLTGQSLGGADAVAARLADRCMPSANLEGLWAALGGLPDAGALPALIGLWAGPACCGDGVTGWSEALEPVFALPTVRDMELALVCLDELPEAQQALASLRKKSPLMLEVSLQQIRRARSMGVGEALRMERDLVRHCFHTHHLGRRGAQTETVEGVRALAVDKDHAPRWKPASLDAVNIEHQVLPFFDSPWPAAAHPLRHLA